MPVPNLSIFVLIAAAVSVTKGSMTSACTLRSSPSPASPAIGRCECSDAHNDSNPRSSSATASSDGEIEYSVNHMVAPKCMTFSASELLMHLHSVRGEAAVNRQADADHEAGAGTA